MSTATCPKCHRQVSLPATDDHSVWVRCPLCSEQYSLRMALDHVPPALEILGPEAGVAMGMQGGETVQNELAMHTDTAIQFDDGIRSDTAGHPEHAADLMPLDMPVGAEHFLAADHGSNGEQPLDLEHAAPAGQPPAPDQVNGQHSDISEHLIDFELEPGEHGAMTEPSELIKHPEMLPPTEHVDFAEHDPAAAVLGEYHGDHTIEPSNLDSEGAEFSGEGDPEFRISDDAEGEHEADDEHAMGGIATLVQSAPPAKKRRKAPLGVKLIGVLLFFGFGFLGCYLVYGAFLWMHSDQFHLKQYFPAFLRNRIADEPPPPPRKPKALERPTPGSLPVATPPAGAPANPAATQTAQANTPDDGAKPSATVPPAGDNTATAPATTPSTTVAPPKPGPSDVATTPAKPAPNTVAQETPGKTAPVESSDDPLKTPPPDLDKHDPTKPDSIAPPKLDTAPTPFDDVKPPAGPKTPSTDKPPEATPDKPATDSPDKPAPSPDKPVTTPDNSAPPVPPDKPAPVPDKPAPTPDKPVTDKPENPAATPSPEKPADNPNPADSKLPVAAELDNLDAAIAATSQAADNLKSAAVPGAEHSAVLRASVANYKAMSHLVTELGAVDAAGAGPDSAARIEDLRKKAAVLAESMGSDAERDTTAMLASKWMASPSRKENGIVVVGTLVKVEPADKGFVAHVKMPSDSKEMTFTTDKKPTAAEGSPVVVLGLLTADEGGKAIEIISPTDEKSSK